MNEFSWKIPRGNGIWEQIIPNNILFTGTNISDHLNNTQLEKIFLNPENYIMGIDPYENKTIIKQKTMSEVVETKKVDQIVMPTEPIKISLKGIIADLENGLTRTKEDTNYNAEVGCIQDKYNLTSTDLRTLFQHSMLKGLRVKPVKKPGFELIEDVETVTLDPAVSSESAFGKPSAATLKELAKTSSEELKTESVDIPF